MPVKITNLLISRPIIIPLTTGATLRLSPGQTSEELADVEVKNNAKVNKLQDRGVIEVGDTEEAEYAAAEAEPDSPPAKRGEYRGRPPKRSDKSSQSAG